VLGEIPYIRYKNITICSEALGCVISLVCLKISNVASGLVFTFTLFYFIDIDLGSYYQLNFHLFQLNVRNSGLQLIQSSITNHIFNIKFDKESIFVKIVKT
jgi:hypothetical protein